MVRKRKVLELETLVKKDGSERNRVPREEQVEEVITPKRSYKRRKSKPADPLRKKSPLNNLTPREEIFAATIVQRMLAGQRGAIGNAAREAGYKAGSASGSALLKRPAVLRVVDQNLNDQLEKVDAETGWLLERLAQTVDFDPRKVTINLQELDDATAMAIESVDFTEIGTVKKYKAASRLNAIRTFLEFKRLIGADKTRGAGQQDRLMELDRAVRAPLEAELNKKD